MAVGQVAPETSPTIPSFDDDTWHMQISPYLWMAGIDGTVSIRNHTVKVEQSFRDIFENSEAIAREAQPRYTHPFKFFLVHESQPNAFATPGGNVYVVDSLLYFVKNTEQLAGTLCHEVSHTIHRDGVALMEKAEN